MAMFLKSCIFVISTHDYMLYVKERPARNQLQLFTCLEDMVSSDNPVRLMDLFLNRLSACFPEKFTGSTPQTTGRKPYAKEDLCKLYLYGYLNRIASSRRLEAETHRNLEVKFLMCGLTPDHKTISDFRRDNGELIRFVCLSFRRFLKDEGYISGVKVAYDGTKVKANVSPETVISITNLDKHLASCEKQLEDYLSRMQTNDRREDTEEVLESAEDIQKDDLSAIRAKIAELEAMKKQLIRSGKSSHCPNDPDASMMKSRDGKKACYNVQTGIDAANKMIAMAEITDSCNDINELQVDNQHLKEQLDIVPEIIEADRGYGNITQIREIEESENTRCAIPMVERWNTVYDREAGVRFTYNPENNTLKCSRGKLLRLLQRGVVHSGVRYDVYRCDAEICKQCPLFGQCTRSKKGRIVKISEHKAFEKDYLQRLETPEYKRLIAERKTLAEHPFGTLKRWMGKVPLLLTGKQKVQTEIDIYTSAYNFRRLLSLTPIAILMQKMKEYNFANGINGLSNSFFLFLAPLADFFSLWEPRKSQTLFRRYAPL